MVPSRHFGRSLFFLLGVTLPGLAQGVLGIAQPSSKPPSGSWSIEVSAFALSDPVPLHGLLNHWQGGFTSDPSPKIYGQWGSRTKATLGNWNISIWDLTTVLGQMSPGGAKLLWLTKQKLALPVGETFAVRLDLDALHRTGASLGRAWMMGNVAFGADVSSWTATGAQFGMMQGQAAVSGPKTYSFDMDVNYAYNQNRLYNLAVPSERGWGYGLNLGATWAWDGWEWQSSARDLGNQTHWNQLPMTMASALSNRNHTDSNGFTVFDPSIEGWEGKRPFTWREPIAWSTSIARHFPEVTALVRLERVGPLIFRALEVEHSFTSDVRASIGYEDRTRLWTIGCASKRAWISLGSTSPSTQRAHGIQFEFGAKGRW
jgi:hypothetical protein